MLKQLNRDNVFCTILVEMQNCHESVDVHCTLYSITHQLINIFKYYYQQYESIGSDRNGVCYESYIHLTLIWLWFEWNNLLFDEPLCQLQFYEYTEWGCKSFQIWGCYIKDGCGFGSGWVVINFVLFRFKTGFHPFNRA